MCCWGIWGIPQQAKKQGVYNLAQLAQKIFELREKKQNVILENAEKNGFKKQVIELEDFIHRFIFELTEYDE